MAPRGKPPDSLAVRKAIEAGGIPPVWLWSGPEEFLKEELFGRLAADLVGEEMAGFNVNRFRAGEDEVDRVLNTCSTLPMLSPRRAVLVRDVEGWGRGDRERLLAYVAHPSPETALVLAGERGPNDSFHKRLVAAGAEPAVFWTPFETQVHKWIRIRFRDAGKECPAEVAAALHRMAGGEGGGQVPLRGIALEVEKVLLAMGEKPSVTREDLEVIGRKADEGLLYEISRQVARRNLAGALRALDGALLFRNNPPVRIVATLAHRLADIARVRDLVDSGVPRGQARRAAQIWWDEAWAEVEEGLRRYRREDLEAGLAALAEADGTLKSSAKSPRVVLEESLIAICG